MEALSEAQILDIWERGRGRSAAEQALVPLSVALPELGAESLAALPVGARDGRLLELRGATLGPQLHGTADCPRCGARVGFSVAVEDILGAGAVRAGAGGAFELVSGTFRLTLRSLDSRDLAAAGAAASLAEARGRLLERAVVAARGEHGEVAVAQLPAAVVAAISQALEERDPLAVVPLAMTCGRCGQHWEPLLDAAAFVWRELEARAERVMTDVHDLAQVYGWSEAAILAISPARRQFYLDLTPSPRGRAGGEEEGSRA